MDQKLQEKCDLIAQNYEIVHKSGKLSFQCAANLGALMFTSAGKLANEETIRQNRELLKSKVGIFSNFRGPINLAILCKMSMHDNPQDYIDSVLRVYQILTENRVIKTEYMAMTAVQIVDNANPADYEKVCAEANTILETMRKVHPLIITSEDLSICALLAMSNLDVANLMIEAEKCYEALDDKVFKFSKDQLQTAALIMSMSQKPLEEKVQRYNNLRELLKEDSHRLPSQYTSILAAFTDSDKSNEEIVEIIAEVDDYLKHKHGFGMLTLGGALRRVFAIALVLQNYEEDKAGQSIAASNSITSMIVETVIMEIITTIIIMTVVNSSNN